MRLKSLAGGADKWFGEDQLKQQMESKSNEQCVFSRHTIATGGAVWQCYYYKIKGCSLTINTFGLKTERVTLPTKDEILHQPEIYISNNNCILGFANPLVAQYTLECNNLQKIYPIHFHEFFSYHIQSNISNDASFISNSKSVNFDHTFLSWKMYCVVDINERLFLKKNE